MAAIRFSTSTLTSVPLIKKLTTFALAKMVTRSVLYNSSVVFSMCDSRGS